MNEKPKKYKARILPWDGYQESKDIYLCSDIDPLLAEKDAEIERLKGSPNSWFYQEQRAEEVERKLKIATDALEKIEGIFSARDGKIIAEMTLAEIESPTVNTSAQVQADGGQYTGPDWDRAHKLDEQMLQAIPSEDKLQEKFQCPQSMDILRRIERLEDITKHLADK